MNDYFFINKVKAAIINCDDCDISQLPSVLGSLSREIVLIFFWIALLIVSIGAFLIMFSGPREDLQKKGKDMIKIAIIGYILILLSVIIIGIILDIFQPRFAFALTPFDFFQPIKIGIGSSLKCGQNSSPILGSDSLGQLFSCIMTAISLLKRISLIILAGTIIFAAGFLIISPLAGLGKAELARKILIWAIIGFLIIILADVIKSQIERLVT